MKLNTILMIDRILIGVLASFSRNLPRRFSLGS